MLLRRLPRGPLTAAAFLFVLAAPSFAGWAATATLGSQALSGFRDMDFGYNISAYYKFDDQVLLGGQSGQGVAGDAAAVPVLAAAYVRLPLGRAIVPVATGSWGYSFSGTRDGFLWRAGGCLDVHNGRRTNILLGGEYEGHQNYGGGIVLRGGLMLEF